MALSVFGRVKTSLSLAMRVLVVIIFMFTLFSYPNRQIVMPRVLLQEIERKVLRFLTPITWTKLGMFSAVGAYGTQLFLQDLRLSNVASVLSTHEAWSDIRHGTISVFRRWRRRHISSQSCYQLEGCVRLFSAYSRHYAFRNLVRSWSLSSKTTFSFFVSTVGWCRTPSLGDLPGTSGASQTMGWSHIASYTTTPAQECASTSQMVPVESTPQCSHSSKNPYNVVSVPDSLIVLTICHVVLQCSTFTTVSVTLQIFPTIIDGRHSLMLQESWGGGSVLASILAFFFLLFG